jgi:hypothetical protein
MHEESVLRKDAFFRHLAVEKRVVVASATIAALASPRLRLVMR